MRKILALLIIYFWSLQNVSAANSLFGDGDLYKITPDSQIQRLMDHSFTKIFLSEAAPQLCQVFQSPAMLSHSMGVTLNTAEQIYKRCPTYVPTILNKPKIYKKQYYVSLNSPQKPFLQSWTTTDNKTILFIDHTTTLDELEKILAHELAIALDGKMSMLLTTYFIFENLHSEIDGEKKIITLPNKLSPEEEKLDEAFLISRFKPIALAFATLRAFNFEKIKDDFKGYKLMEHQLCASSVKALTSFFVNHKDDFKGDGSIAQKLVEAITGGDKLASQNLLDAFRKILNPDFKIISEDREMTFCQYMSHPMLVSKSALATYANGPRPRVTGGWGPEEGLSSPRQIEIMEKIEQEQNMAKEMASQNVKSAAIKGYLNLDLVEKKIINVKEIQLEKQ